MNDLRVAALVEMTVWERDAGQAYRLTPLGQEVLSTPGLIEQVRTGQRVRPTAPEPDPTDDEAAPTAFQRGEEARAALYEGRSASSRRCCS